ncbi:hypothetical protein KY360_00660 [Candidatus Woesearchaeota archaeon]|nr:hypothetical protein [Candidatus Woesearchaeota archaeon]
MGKSDNSEIKEYIEKHIEKGFSLGEIKKSLIEGGHDKDIVESGMEPFKGMVAQSKTKVKPIIIGFVVLMVVVASAIFIFQNFMAEEEVEEPIDYQRKEESANTDCCYLFIESNFTDFSTCQKNYYLALTSAIIKQDESFLDLWKMKDEPDSDEFFIFLDSNRGKIGRYFIYTFGNKYLNKNKDAETIKAELLNDVENLISAEDLALFSDLLDIEDKPYFPGTLPAKNYFEKKDFCHEDDWTMDRLCRAVIFMDPNLCESGNRE